MSAFVDRNAPIIQAVAEAFLAIQEAVWPNDAVRGTLRSGAFRARAGAAAVSAFAEAVEALCSAYPSVRVFWKDVDLRFLGVSELLAQEAGLSNVDAIVGLLDDDQLLPWSRQAAKYQRDDRMVIAAGKPLLDILERQDSGPDSTRWLRTSKTPIVAEGRVAGIMGAFDVISDQEAMALAKKQGRPLG